MAHIKPYKRQHNDAYSEEEDIRKLTSLSPRSNRLLNRPDNRADYDSDKVSSPEVVQKVILHRECSFCAVGTHPTGMLSCLKLKR